MPSLTGLAPLSHLPRTYVRGYHMPSLSGLECGGCVPRLRQKFGSHAPSKALVFIGSGRHDCRALPEPIDQMARWLLAFQLPYSPPRLVDRLIRIGGGASVRVGDGDLSKGLACYFAWSFAALEYE